MPTDCLSLVRLMVRVHTTVQLRPYRVQTFPDRASKILTGANRENREGECLEALLPPLSRVGSCDDASTGQLHGTAPRQQ